MTTRHLSSPLTPAQVEGQAAVGGYVTWGPVAPEVWASLAGQDVVLIASSQADYPARVTAYDDARRELTVQVGPVPLGPTGPQLWRDRVRDGDRISWQAASGWHELTGVVRFATADAVHVVSDANGLIYGIAWPRVTGHTPKTRSDGKGGRASA